MAMSGFQKHQLGLAALALVAFMAAGPSPAQDDPEERVDTLLSQLAEPDRGDWAAIENQIMRIWSRSGSEAMDMLLRRGRDAIDAEDYATAVEHLTALTDHAPDFAEGWNARATAFYMQGEFSLAMADVERVLALNPRHYRAMSGLGFMLEDMGETEYALAAFRAAEALNPHMPDVRSAIERLERRTGGAEL
jgi:tetratricopeptide (TPR) repeat protein